ncbi:MAG TPA: helix-turn-helix transcriptional regulator [Thermoanaerobaculia bacterium]|nr:helix-turn-helix transcriptional regulator [Thermoanaerobaculia bacterium]
MHKTFEHLGPTLRLLREQAGLSQAGAASEAGMSKSQLSKYETGRELPKLDSLERILRVLKTEPLWLFYLADLLSRQVPDPAVSIPVLALLQADSIPFLRETEVAAFRGLFDHVLNLYQQAIESRVLLAARPSRPL